MNPSKTESGIPSNIVSSSKIKMSKTDQRKPSITESNSGIKISKTDQRIHSITESNSDIKTKETWGWKIVELSEDQQWERVNVLLTSFAILLILNASLLLYYVMLSSPKTILVNRTIPRQEIVGKITLLFGDIILVVQKKQSETV